MSISNKLDKIVKIIFISICIIGLIFISIRYYNQNHEKKRLNDEKYIVTDPNTTTPEGLNITISNVKEVTYLNWERHGNQNIITISFIPWGYWYQEDLNHVGCYSSNEETGLIDGKYAWWYLSKWSKSLVTTNTHEAKDEEVTLILTNYYGTSNYFWYDIKPDKGLGIDIEIEAIGEWINKFDENDSYII